MLVAWDSGYSGSTNTIHETIPVLKRLYSVSGNTWIRSLNFPTREFAWHHSPRNAAHLSLQPLWKGTQAKYLISQVGCWAADALEVCCSARWWPMDCQVTSLELAVNNASTPMHPAAHRHSVSHFPRVSCKTEVKEPNLDLLSADCNHRVLPIPPSKYFLPYYPPLSHLSAIM